MSAPGVYLDMDEQAYHSSPALSSTGARALLKSPARFQWEREHPVVKDVFDVGSAVHTMVLGTGWPVVVIEADDWRGKTAREQRDAARANGQVALLVKDFDTVTAMAGAVLTHPVAGPLFEDGGECEVSAFATDPSTGVELRARFDYLTSKRIVDLKSTTNADPDTFARKSAAEFGYMTQEAFYRHVLSLARGDDAEFRFVAVEKYPPYLVSVIELDEEFVQIGRSQMRRAIDLYAECCERDDWPGYEPITHLVGAPSWLRYAEGMAL